MSSNRSVQAAQRRRAVPNEAPPSSRGPQPSINSSQMFARQAQANQQNLANQNNINNIGKMTLPQAITLITLRIGSLESKMQNLSNNQPYYSSNEDGLIAIDKSILDSILNRLESVEKRSSNSSSGNSTTPEINLVKQQMESIKQTIIQNKTVFVNMGKENKDLKFQIENMKTELFETKEMLNSLQNIALENSQKILNFTLNGVDYLSNEENFDNQNEITYDEVSDQFSEMNLKQFSENEFSEYDIINNNP
uniref:Uncharacterized protein n=1 Tax=viral metagenome TaxID=1070528 RepID=A0A6C0KMW5_9ZZZZ